MEPAEFSRGFWTGKNPQPTNPRQRKSFRLGIFLVEKIQLVPRRNFGGNEKSERIWSNDLSQSRAYNLFAYNQTACSKSRRGHIFRKYTNTTDTVIRRMLRISQDLRLGEFCIILKDDSSLGGIHSRKSKLDSQADALQ